MTLPCETHCHVKSMFSACSHIWVYRSCRTWLLLYNSCFSYVSQYTIYTKRVPFDNEISPYSLSPLSNKRYHSSIISALIKNIIEPMIIYCVSFTLKEKTHKMFKNVSWTKYEVYFSSHFGKLFLVSLDIFFYHKRRQIYRALHMTCGGERQDIVVTNEKLISKT